MGLGPVAKIALYGRRLNDARQVTLRRLCLGVAAAMLFCMSADVAHAQASGDGSASADTSSLTVQQDKVMDFIRSDDRSLYVKAARDAGLKDERDVIKPVRDWTQDDYQSFMVQYLHLKNQGQLGEIVDRSEYELLRFFLDAGLGGGGDGGDGGD